MAEKQTDEVKKYFPPDSEDYVIRQIKKYRIDLKFVRPRSTKTGDYRPPSPPYGHRISLNNDLNALSMLTTFLHELAHLHVHEKYFFRRSPHGRHWFAEFRKLMLEATKLGLYPDAISEIIRQTIIEKKAGNYRSVLSYALNPRDDTSDKLLLKDLGPGYEITIRNNRRFRVIEKLRRRYKCIDLKNGRLYLVHGDAEIYHYNSIQP
ncbi:MAG: hypothetical protein ABIJ16_07955 [Bacteroidota bacterium]